MKKFLKRVWVAINSPIADILGGFISIYVGLFLCVKFCDFDKSHIFAWIAGFLFAVGYDCIDHGVDRFKLRKSLAPADDDKKSQ